MLSPRVLSALALVALAGPACQPAPDADTGETESTGAALNSLQRRLSDMRVGPCANPGNYEDADGDGLADASETCVMQQSAPAFNLYYSDEDDQEDHWPVNVDWFLARTELWFKHGSCGDHLVAPTGTRNQSTLLDVSHPKVPVGGWRGGCGHTATQALPTSDQWDNDQYYFLHVLNEGDHVGSYNDGDWKVYSHIYPNDFGGVDVQYWLIFAFNDGAFTGGNHEGDWEGITVRRWGDGTVREVVIGEHGNQHRYPPQLLTWTGTHPHVWVAKGSHAMFPQEKLCDLVEENAHWNSPGCEGGIRQWRTWPGGYDGRGWRGGGLVNVGEIPQPLNGQSFIKANILWGAGDGPRAISWFGAWKFFTGALQSGPTASGDTMRPGQVLAPDQPITSSDGRYRLVYQKADGNLVLYRNADNAPLWATGTNGSIVGVCIMQTDGNLVIYAPGGRAVWSSGTHRNDGSRLVMQTDGNLVIYRPNGTAIWATNTVQ